MWENDAILFNEVKIKMKKIWMKVKRAPQLFRLIHWAIISVKICDEEQGMENELGFKSSISFKHRLYANY